ncbi:MAG: lysophospholipid acyltransferase family protein [Polyangiaceae bacterium]
MENVLHGQRQRSTLATADDEREVDLLGQGAGVLSRVERMQLEFVRRTFRQGNVDKGVRVLQRKLGAIWIERCMKNVRHVYNLDRVPPLDPKKSYICVSNHRSFFDLYVVTAYLVYRDLLPHRILFPVRSKFFYDNPLGLFVNGAMSFFAMYPPVFREPNRTHLNPLVLDEVTRLAKRGGFFVGVHPEGLRNRGNDPYDLLPARYGVGRIVHGSGATVLPVFVNGLCNDIVKQIKGNFDGTGERAHVVFGKPVDMSDLLAQPAERSTYQLIANRSLAAVKQLAEEERRIRYDLA